MKEKLDAYDKKILYYIDLNARGSASQIAKKIKLPKETVNYRIKRLQKNDWIKRFYTIFNASLFGYSYYKIYLKFHRLTAGMEKQIIEYIRSSPSCANLRITEGQYDMVFLTIHKNISELRKFMQHFFNLFGMYVLEKNIHTMTKTHKLNQKFLYNGKTIKKTFNQIDIRDYSLDTVDVGIIELLSTNARIKLIDIAQHLRLDSRIIKYRVKKMEQTGIIVEYTTALNLTSLNREFIQIDIVLKDPSYIPSIIDFFDSTNTCIFVYELLGKYDVSTEIYVENDEMLRNILEKFKELFLDSYVYYDLSHVYREYVINWSPFHAANNKQ